MIAQEKSYNFCLGHFFCDAYFSNYRAVPELLTHPVYWGVNITRDIDEETEKETRRTRPMQDREAEAEIDREIETKRQRQGARDTEIEIERQIDKQIKTER